MDKSEKLTHPSYGVITVGRTSRSKGTPLFGSRVTHRETVSVEIKGAFIRRNLSSDFIHGSGSIVSFEMSAAQWATFVSSFGIGEGTPITLRYRPEGKGIVDCGQPPSLPSELTQHEIEAEETSAHLKQLTNELLQNYDALTLKPTKKGMADFRREIANYFMEFDANLPFVLDSLKKSMHTVVEDAKVEVEAFTQNYVTQLGKAALAQTAIPTFDGKNPLGLESSTHERELPGVLQED